MRIADIVAETQELKLQDRLQRMAEVLTGEIPGIRGTILMARDEGGLPLALGGYRLGFTKKGSTPSFEELTEIQEGDSGWLRARSEFFEPTDVNRVILIRQLRMNGRPLGAHLVELSHSESTALEQLDGLDQHLAWFIQEALQRHHLQRLKQLQELARDELTQEDLTIKRLETIVRKLATIFLADVVTILLRIKDELRLSVTTDKRLKEKNVTYKKGQGLTGYIFETGRPLRLREGLDDKELRAATKVERQRHFHFERASDGTRTTQFLGVPMRSGGVLEGVLKMTRLPGMAYFSKYDEESLQFFADILGVAHTRFWSTLLYKSILDSDNEAICISHRETDDVGESTPRIVFVNRGATTLFRKSEVDFVGIDARELYPESVYKRIKSTIKKNLKTGRTSLTEVPSQIILSDDTIRYVTASYRLLQNGLVKPPAQYTISIFRDTHDVQKAQEQHRRLMEMLTEKGLAYFRAGKNGVTLETSDAEIAITGYSRGELLSMNRRRLYQGPRKREDLIRRVKGRRGKLTHTIELLRTKEGEKIWIEGEVRLLKGFEGHEVGMEGLYQDVTDRVSLQTFLGEDSSSVLQDLELLKKVRDNAQFHLDYTRSLDHQLQSPLSSLIEVLRNMEQDVLKDKEVKAERLRYVIGQAISCARLVRNLFHMDQILRGDPFRSEPVALLRVIVDIEETFAHLIRAKQLDFVVEDGVRKCLTILGHQELLHQAIANLVDNAIKFSFPHTKIRVDGKRNDDGRILEISNQGLTIEGENRERIFARGFRGPKARLYVPAGTGFGLWLVRRIIQAHGGSISCGESVVDNVRRTVFSIVFPHPRR